MRVLSIFLGVVLALVVAGAGWLKYRQVILTDMRAVADGEGVRITARADYSRIPAGSLVTSYQRVDTWVCDRPDLGKMNAEPTVGALRARDYFMSGDRPRRDVRLSWSSTLKFVTMSDGDHGLLIRHDGREAARSAGLCMRLRGFDRWYLPLSSNTARVALPPSSWNRG